MQTRGRRAKAPAEASAPNTNTTRAGQPSIAKSRRKREDDQGDVQGESAPKKKREGGRPKARGGKTPVIDGENATEEAAEADAFMNPFTGPRYEYHGPDTSAPSPPPFHPTMTVAEAVHWRPNETPERPSPEHADLLAAAPVSLSPGSWPIDPDLNSRLSTVRTKHLVAHQEVIAPETALQSPFAFAPLPFHKPSPACLLSSPAPGDC